MKTLLSAIAEAFKVPEEEINGPRQDREFCDARKAYFYFLRDVMGLPWWKITNLTGRKIAHIAYNRKQCVILYDLEPSYRKSIDVVMRQYVDNLIEPL